MDLKRYQIAYGSIIVSLKIKYLLQFQSLTFVIPIFLLEPNTREIYVTKGFMEEINEESTLEISGQFCANISPLLPDNFGVSFSW